MVKLYRAIKNYIYTIYIYIYIYIYTVYIVSFFHFSHGIKKKGVMIFLFQNYDFFLSLYLAIVNYKLTILSEL